MNLDGVLVVDLQSVAMSYQIAFTGNQCESVKVQNKGCINVIKCFWTHTKRTVLHVREEVIVEVAWLVRQD